MPRDAKQLRKVVVPLTTLLEYIDRRSKELENAKLHRAQVDERRGLLVMFVQSDTDVVKPLHLEIDWDEVFGQKCPEQGCDRMKFVALTEECPQCHGQVLVDLDKPEPSE